MVCLSASSIPWDHRWVNAEIVGPFWDILESLGVVLLVTREYEHFVVALSCDSRGPHMSVMRVPHPSGLAVDHERKRVYVACTRNPNQVMEFGVADNWLNRADTSGQTAPTGLVPIATRFLPGCMYLHDLAVIGGRLYGNAVGMNAIVDLTENPSVVWWPSTVDGPNGPDLSSNRIHMNSIAAGSSIATSFFAASNERPGEHRPGDPHWEVDGQGVVFSGATGEAVVRGLTRPHSVRLDGDGSLWLDDSGYGRLCICRNGLASTVAQLPGWTRGLCLLDRIAVVGTSRVIPGFERYAPGLAADSSTCGLHLVDRVTGLVEASLLWPKGNQIFAIDVVSTSFARGFLGGDPVIDSSAVENAWYKYRPPGFSVIST